MSKRTSSPRVIDLFAGAGLFSSAFKAVGFDLIQAVELDRHAAASYALNHGHHITVDDVRRVRPVGECDVIIAGPPCQGFSALGKRDPQDERNLLSLDVLRWVRACRPRAVVIENVPPFLDAPVWGQLARGLERQGFGISTFVLDAAEYGVGQLRRRSFTIAVADGEHLSTPRPARERVTVRDAWSGLPRRRGDPLGHAPEPSSLAFRRMRLIGPGGDRRDVMKRAPSLVPGSWVSLACQVTDVWGRMRYDRPSNTLRTSFQNPSKGRYIHPTEHRVITLREGARLHSVPDAYQFSGSPTAIARQIGNGVPPRLGTAIAKAIRGVL